MPSLNTAALARIRDQSYALLAELLRPGTRAALVDFPNHENAGDHLISLGQDAYFARLGLKIDYVGDITRYDKDDLDHFVPDGPILIQGGGNFGDRWTEIQKFRERVISENHDRRIIQLPQSVDFTTQTGLRQAQDVYRAHPNLTLLIRDRAGAQLTAELFPQNTVRFCPDLALGAPLDSRSAKTGEPRFDVVYLKRGDSESTGSAVSLPRALTALSSDWGLGRADKVKWWAMHAPGALSRRLPLMRRPLYPLQHRLYTQMSRLNVDSAQRLILQGSVVVTDRLHASVMAILLGRRVVAMDNANGKVSAIYGDYLHDLGLMTLVADGREASDVLSSIQI
ncbi:polysaccharide pyruvyl transferase family protein [Microbacterium arborescens]|uniref:polysaccharide pyruvyl transferase family protein n=1 Tax=Microbacterium arborescens TaxID=33883 RepID=UPI0025A19A26|nr:polysaccharide pyruvyl transferase family protein [Microbacterium arborescens]WJM15294.1 polysaccharide pyruvyl transferase family protein [Microbacterium arborescens]